MTIPRVSLELAADWYQLPPRGFDPNNTSASALELKEQGRSQFDRVMALARTEYFLWCFWIIAERSRVITTARGQTDSWYGMAERAYQNRLTLYRLIRDGVSEDWYFLPDGHQQQIQSLMFVREYNSHLEHLRLNRQRCEEYLQRGEQQLFIFLFNPGLDIFQRLGLTEDEIISTANPLREPGRT